MTEILNLNRAGYLNFTEQDYFGSSVNSKFFPVNLFTSTELRHFDKISPDQTSIEPFIFKKMEPTYFSTERKYEFFLSALSGTSLGSRFMYTIGGVERSVKVSLGTIETVNSDILSLLCVKDCKINFEADNLILLVAKEFSSRPQYKNVYKRYKKDYLDVVSRNGIDVLESTSLGILNMVYPEVALPDLGGYSELISFGTNFKFSHVKDVVPKSVPFSEAPNVPEEVIIEEVSPEEEISTIEISPEAEEFQNVLRIFEEMDGFASPTCGGVVPEDDQEIWEELMGQFGEEID